MAEETPNPSNEPGKVQPKKETVRINLPPKPTAAPTVRLPAPSAAGVAAPKTATAAPVGGAAPAAKPAAPAEAKPAAASAPRPAAVPAAAPAPRPAARRAPAAASVSGLDVGLAIAAAVVGAATLVHILLMVTTIS